MNVSPNNLSELADMYACTYINGDNNLLLNSFLKRASYELKLRTKRNLWSKLKLLYTIQKIRVKGKTSDAVTKNSYDQEYRNGFGAYGYVSAMLSKEGFELITGLKEDIISKTTLIDVGAGSNEFLRFCRDILKVPLNQLHGSDISSASRQKIEGDGCRAYLGRLEDLGLPSKFFDLIYLSYFIDYDTNQSATFETVINLTKPGGMIVLEGLFPVKPFGLLKKDVSTCAFITKGINATEDIILVTEAFKGLGEKIGREVSLRKIVKTHRFVNSHYGFHRLPSYFLVFSVL